MLVFGLLLLGWPQRYKGIVGTFCSVFLVAAIVCLPNTYAELRSRAPSSWFWDVRLRLVTLHLRLLVLPLFGIGFIERVERLPRPLRPTTSDRPRANREMAPTLETGPVVGEVSPEVFTDVTLRVIS